MGRRSVLSATFLFAACLVGGVLGVDLTARGIDAKVSCNQIAAAISNASDVYWPRMFICLLLSIHLMVLFHSFTSLPQGCESLGKVELRLFDVFS